MASQPCSSKALSSVINQEFLNRSTNIESARFLKRILQKSEEEGKLSKTIPSDLDRTHFYTGLDRRMFFTQYTDLKATEIKDIERSMIHERLIAFYINANASSLPPRPDTTPTTKNLFSALYGKIPHYVDIRMFRKCLAKLGYVWLRIFKGYIVMERPSVTFERYYYLKDIVRYREENRDIFYVAETVLTGLFNYYSFKEYNELMKTAVNARIEIIQKGLIKNIYAVSKSGVYALKTIDHFTTSNFANWVINELLPVLPEKSVVVIQKYEHHDDVIKKPTLFSIKSDIIAWLELNDVPYSEEMSKCELVDLVDAYTSESDEISKIENSLKLKGHELLRLPACIEEMTTSKHFFELIKLNASKVNVNHDQVLKMITESVSLQTFEKFDRHVADAEKDTLHADIKMDQVFDNVVAAFQKVRLKDAEDSEVPLSDSD
ncbi:uncharacterized protein LOC133530729 [Cydia pomonella]|uniref:uncharacterized protein LOC133530729 n=1 Tax=Cydia pomonella TaxID=82600 RepID=UPI002ADDBFF7|nr:uncharacterized protein LOC133530729 [Cydia pomonella]